MAEAYEVPMGKSGYHRSFFYFFSLRMSIESAFG